MNPCEECNDPTRYVVGTYSGFDVETHELVSGTLYACENADCPHTPDHALAFKFADYPYQKEVET
jgi:hypothetical protein